MVSVDQLDLTFWSIFESMLNDALHPWPSIIFQTLYIIDVLSELIFVKLWVDIDDLFITLAPRIWYGTVVVWLVGVWH